MARKSTSTQQKPGARGAESPPPGGVATAATGRRRTRQARRSPGDPTNKTARRRAASQGLAKARRARSKKKSATRKALQTPSEALPNVDAGTDGARRPRPSFWRYLQAVVFLIEKRQAPTVRNIAKELHITPQAVWALQRRHPDLLAFVDEQLCSQNRHRFGRVQLTCAVLGEQGSAAHADLYFKSLNPYFLTGGLPPSDGEQPPGAGQVTINLLVPRPPPVEVSEPAALLPAPAVIPTIAVR